MIKTKLFKTPKNKTNQQQKRMASVAILIALKRNQVFYLRKSCYAVLRAFRFYENIFQLFLTSVKKNCIIIFFCETR